MSADILALIARLRAAPALAWGDRESKMRRATRGEVCLDAGKTMRISVSGPLTAGF